MESLKRKYPDDHMRKWLRHWDEFTVVLATTLATVLGWPRLCPPGRPMSEEGMELIVWTDALGLAVFAAVGAHYGSLAEPRLHLCGCGLCGMFTGYGALTIAEVLPADGKMISCEIDPFLKEFSAPFFAKVIASVALHRRMKYALWCPFR